MGILRAERGIEGGYTLAAAYDAPTDKVFVRASESFHIYDLKTDSWRRIDMGYPPYYPR
ncbi:MAG: hypothetical protein H6729_08720 [Deltaproteobacteria bacterium]|nr:hypothetical protein [Deltaproteobacteria bacterium]